MTQRRGEDAVGETNCEKPAAGLNETERAGVQGLAREELVMHAVFFIGMVFIENLYKPFGRRKRPLSSKLWGTDPSHPQAEEIGSS